MNLHKNLSKNRWYEFSFIDQMANVGTGVERAISWKKSGSDYNSECALERALELL